MSFPKARLNLNPRERAPVVKLVNTPDSESGAHKAFRFDSCQGYPIMTSQEKYITRHTQLQFLLQ